MPPIWIFTGQDTSIALSHPRPPDKVQVSGKALGLVQTYPKKTMTSQVKQHDAGGYKTGRVSTDLSALRNAQRQFTARICASVPPICMQGYFTSCDVGVQLLY